MTRRRLRPDELDLWQQVAKSADPLATRNFGGRLTEDTPNPKPKRRVNPPLEPFALGAKSTTRTQTSALPQTTSERLRSEQVQMDSKAFMRLRRGKMLPEARIDLHGMTLDQAHPELARFILQSQMRGMRLVLVITGKGQREDPYDPMPRRRGVLKSHVPQWLKMAPLSQAVLQVSEAHRKHGGEGAYYVYLRRNR